MNTNEIKNKLLMGQMSDDEFAALMNKGHQKKGSSFLKTLITGFQKGYAEPQMLKAILEFTLLLLIAGGTIILTYAGKLEVMATAILLSVITGYLLGKLK